MAYAATPACGSGCLALAAQSWGPNYVTSDPGSATAGQDIILARAAEFSAEDFILRDEGTVASLYSDGILGPAPAYLRALAAATKRSGGLFVADEVQAGFGRTGAVKGASGDIRASYSGAK